MVAVLMSTYNGKDFLEEQINSILTQSYGDFVLHIRDDGSGDGTWELLHSFRDPRIRLYRGGNLGPAGSFFELLRQAGEADYVFFSDQDDIWYPDKLEKMLGVIQKYDDGPAMVFSDFAMIDQNGTVTNESYSRYANLRVAPGEIPVNQILAQPYVFGCASVINGKLAQLVKEPPDQIEMHDCWISLTAASVGKLIYMPERTISHRFHSSNATGRQGQSSAGTRFSRITKGFSAQAENTRLRLHQVDLLLDTYPDQLHPQVRTMLQALSKANEKGSCSMVRALIQYGVGRQKAINTLFFYITVFGS